MTLLLGALKPNACVLAADGMEFTHAPGAAKRETSLSQQKIFPISGQAIAIGIHGQNRIVHVDQTLNEQRLVIDVLQQVIPTLGGISTVKDLCLALSEAISKDVGHTLALLSSAKLVTAPVGLLTVGFDSDGGELKCYDVMWPLNATNGSFQVEPVSEMVKFPTVLHKGTGASIASAVVRSGGHYSSQRLRRMPIRDVRAYVRQLYGKAHSMQESGQLEFGGKYHEITITPEGAQWTQAPTAA